MSQSGAMDINGGWRQHATCDLVADVCFACFFFAKEMVNPEKLRRFYRFWNVRGLFAETALRRSSLCDCVGFIGSLRARLVIS